MLCETEGSLLCRVVTMMGGLLVVASIVELRVRLFSLMLELLVTGSFLTVYVVVVTGMLGPRQSLDP